MFTAKCKLYNKFGNSKPKRKQDIASGDLAKLKDICLGDQQTAEQPRRLTQAVWFILSFNLGCRGREIYLQLKQESITFHVDNAGLMTIMTQVNILNDIVNVIYDGNVTFMMIMLNTYIK